MNAPSNKGGVRWVRTGAVEANKAIESVILTPKSSQSQELESFDVRENIEPPTIEGPVLKLGVVTAVLSVMHSMTHARYHIDQYLAEMDTEVDYINIDIRTNSKSERLARADHRSGLFLKTMKRLAFCAGAIGSIIVLKGYIIS